MLRVPRYTRSNYQTIISTHYSAQDTSGWIDFADVIRGMSESFVASYSGVNASGTGAVIRDTPSLSTQKTGIPSLPTTKDLLVASKLLVPTLWSCSYFWWNIGKGTHNGIDILMPQGTPIASFSGWVVHKVQKRDGKKKDGGNLVVIKSPHVYRSYLHLDTIAVTPGQTIKAGQVIGTCGTTGNSTQYHLHLQVDKLTSKFQPYRSDSLVNIQANSLDPLPFLRQLTQSWWTSGAWTSTGTWSSSDLFSDMPTDTVYRAAITELVQKKIVTWSGWKIFPTDPITRGHFAIVAVRVMKLLGLDSSLPMVNTGGMPFVDIAGASADVYQSIEQLWQRWLMVGSGDTFRPGDPLRGVEAIAVLGKMVYRIQTSPDITPWYKNYVTAFTKYGLIPTSRAFVSKNITRQEMFRIIAAMI